MILMGEPTSAMRRSRLRQFDRLQRRILAGIALSDGRIQMDSLGSFEAEGREFSLPRFVFQGEQDDEPILKLGIFAGVHGEEVAGILACYDLLRFFQVQPFLARAYHLYFYPLINPTGFEASSRYAQTGADLNREFWRE